jgi:steroid 5-alpha reductase family enzyme
MALPMLKTLPDCTDFSLTVQPYLPQLYALPRQIFSHLNDSHALKSLYLDTNPVISAFAFALGLTPVVLVISEINKNYSQVDRIWSILPVIYNCHYALWAHLQGYPAQKLDHIVAVSVIWGLRLTFNYWRKGGYSVGSEDYRWEVLRKYLSPPVMFLFNVLFISLAQNILLFLITTPTYVLLLTSRLKEEGMSYFDIFFSRFMLLVVVLEFFADQQQWNFHQAKKEYSETAKPVPGYSREELDRGFLTSGLWGWSRHPNFAAEQAFWVSLYQWCCCETDSYMNWTFLGAMSYMILFQASTWFTESISAKKYPDYRYYQKQVGKFLPKWSSLKLDNAEEVVSEKGKKGEKVKNSTNGKKKA